MTTKTIPLKAVNEVLWLTMINQARVRLQLNSLPPKRFAAFTNVPTFGPTCRRKFRSEERQAIHTGVMNCGDLGRVVSRTHLQHGVTEVRRIWGAGVREVQADIGSGAMR